MNKIRVTYNDFTEETYDSIELAEKGILESFADGILPELVEDDATGSIGYGCTWSVKLELL